MILSDTQSFIPCLLFVHADYKLKFYQIKWYSCADLVVGNGEGKYIMILRQNHRAHNQNSLQSVVLQHVPTIEHHNTNNSFINCKKCQCLHNVITQEKNRSYELEFKGTNVTFYCHQEHQNWILGFIRGVIRLLRFKLTYQTKYGVLKILSFEEWSHCAIL